MPPLRITIAGVTCAFAAPVVMGAAAGFANLTLAEAIGRLSADGLSVLYSSDLVHPGMAVQTEPTATEPQAILAEIVAPHGLAVARGPGDTVLLVRADGPPMGRLVGRVRDAGNGSPVAGVRVQLGGLEPRAVTTADGRFAFPAVPPGRYPLEVDGDKWLLVDNYIARVSIGHTTSLGVEVSATAVDPPDEIVVSTSRYELGDVPAPSLAQFSAADLQAMPSIGDDPLRAANRLPGTAGSDISAKGNIRGGEADDTLVRFDGLRLYNPFHLKDFKGAFSAIDPSLVERMEVSTGGFPARFGARMGGVIDIVALQPVEQPYRELTVSFFNAGALAAGGLDGGDGEWLVSARRSNLDLWFDLLDPDLGSPRYTEIYGRLGHRLGHGWHATASVLVFDDDIELADEDREEVAEATYRDAYAWLTLDYEGDGSTARLIAAHTDLDSDRAGIVDQPGVSSGRLEDHREASIDSLQVDMSWIVATALRLQAGADWRRSSADYRYRDEAQFDLLFLTRGTPTEPTRDRDLGASPRGTDLGAYASLRAGIAPRLTAEAGLRWDRETLTAANDSRFSPRAGLLFEPSSATQLRLAWGSYWQPQAINELQIADGLTEFGPAQRADHWIASIGHRFEGGLAVRLEAYRKDYERLRPRYENLLHTLVLLPELKPDRLRVSPESATAEGVEVSLRSDPSLPFSWWTSYVWSRVADKLPGGKELRAWDQRHAVGGGLVWRDERWEWTLAGGWHSGWPTTSVWLAEVDPLPLAASGPRNASRLDSYFSLDTRLARHWRFPDGDAVTVFLEITNITDRVNECCLEYEVNDDIGELQLEVQSVDSLRLLPSLGFVWRF